MKTIYVNFPDELSEDISATVYHYGFPPIVLFSRTKIGDWLDAVQHTIGVESVVLSDGRRLQIQQSPEITVGPGSQYAYTGLTDRLWCLLERVAE